MRSGPEQSSYFFVLMLALMAMPSWSLTTQRVDELQREDLTFGYSVAVDGDTALIAAVSSYGTPSGVAYVFIRAGDGWVEQAKLFPDITGSSYGLAVALEGDTAVITAPNFERGGGSAYVFARSGTTWSLESRIFPNDSATGDGFGRSAAIDGGTILIGGFAGPDVPGAAYVFTRRAGVWSQQAKLTAHAEDNTRYFGTSVGLDGDTAVIGADGTDPRGAAYVFTRSSGAWSQQAKLTVAEGFGFGRAVALDKDTVLVGGPSAAYAFARLAGVWNQQARLTVDDGGGFGTRFTHSIALEPDVALIGAPWRDPHRIGAAYLFRLDRGTWTLEEKLGADDPRSDDEFGLAVSLSGNTALIGIPGRSSANVYRLGPDPRLHCAADINGDGRLNLVVVTSEGDVVVRALDGSLVNRFSLQPSGDWVDTELMRDTNGNGAPELVVLAPATAEVRDLLTGGDLGTVSFDADFAASDLELVPDQSGNGIPELAVLKADPMQLEIRDGLTGSALTEVGYADYLIGRDLLMYPDLGGNGWPEIAVLADNRRSFGADKIEIRDTATGAVVREIWLGWDWRVLEQELIADLNGNGSKEVAVLRVHPDGNVNVQIRDTVTREWLNFVGFAMQYPPQELVVIPDINGNGADELVVFGWRFLGGHQKAVIKDSKTGHKLGELWFDRNSPGKDFVACGDLNSNGAIDLALLGRQHRDGRLNVIVKDGKTGERLALVWF